MITENEGSNWQRIANEFLEVAQRNSEYPGDIAAAAAELSAKAIVVITLMAEYENPTIILEEFIRTLRKITRAVFNDHKNLSTSVH